MMDQPKDGRDQMSNQRANEGPRFGYAGPRGTANEVQLPFRPTYSQAVTSSAASYPPLMASDREISQPNRLTGGNARGIRGQYRGSRADSPRARGISRGTASRDATPPSRGGFRPREMDARVTNEDQNMNENLTERIGRGKAFQQNADPVTSRPPMKTNMSIRKYVKTFDRPVDLKHWTGYREIPSSEEVFEPSRQKHNENIDVSNNIVVGPYESKEDYLERHYTLLREDAVAPLRDAVSEVQAYPNQMEKGSDLGAHIYEKVFITGFTFATVGIAARITFSLRRVGKKVNWEQSKRLLTGAIVALTPAKDMFKTVCLVAVIAARPLAGLEHNPPEIDLFFGASDEIEIDPQQEWLMVESRNGFYEAHRHTLQGLQMLAKEEFPLSEHIVEMERTVQPPKYVENQPQKDLSTLFTTGGQEVLNVDILTKWPGELPSQLDASQMEALRRILAKRLAIVQGPPGTGKTHVSVIALRLLLENMPPDDAPIVVAAHTNHALDQLLRHIAVFEPEFIRLGAWTKDTETIKPRTLFEIKSGVKYSSPLGSLRGPALAQIRAMSREMVTLLAPLTEGNEPLPASLFLKHQVITETQYDSLIKGAKDWVSAGAEDAVSGEIAMWLGDERMEAKQRTLPEDFGIEIEEADLEFEQLKELEAESKIVDDEDYETLKGIRTVFNEPFTGQRSMGVTEETIKTEIQKTDLWDIPSDYRGLVYRHLQQKVKEVMRTNFRAMACRYASLCREAKIGTWELDYNFLKQARVVGMTTTGLSKYRGLIQSLDPKIVVIEEAAETLEGPIAVACFKTLEHLVLVGDHQQLRAHCNDEELAGKPFYLGVSMFERLVRNKVEFSQLNRQRRMIPEIRRVLQPIYQNLEDHPSVRDREPVPGMGGVNSFFFIHKWRETSDTQMSKTNVEEADTIVGFFNYLVQNGMAASEITVLTFYNGQRKLILRKLREHRQFGRGFFKVVTVDSYQGEENVVVLLSLVRSNVDAKIGFLEVENRVCVALSRAQRGFYLFGDAPNLCKSSMLWWCVVQAMAKNPCRIGYYLHLTCEKHKNKTYVKDPYDFHGLDGGCTVPCREKMACGHDCTLNCHPFSHDQVDCEQRCTRLLECGHPCTQMCHSECKSDCECTALEPIQEAKTTGVSLEKKAPQPRSSRRLSPVKVEAAHRRMPTHHRASTQLVDYSPADNLAFNSTDNKPTNPTSRDIKQEIKPFREYAAGGHADSDKNLAALAALAEQESVEARQKRLDDETYSALFGDSSAPVLTERKTDNVELVRTKSDGMGGSRGVWKGTFEVPKAKKTSPKKTEENSLLDL